MQTVNRRGFIKATAITALLWIGGVVRADRPAAISTASPAPGTPEPWPDRSIVHYGVKNARGATNPDDYGKLCGWDRFGERAFIYVEGETTTAIPTCPKCIRELARWLTQFNSWDWPTDYPHPKPDDYDELPNSHPNRTQMTGPIDKRRVLAPHVDALDRLVPAKERMRYWHTERLGSTNDEFEAWWTENEANTLAIDRVVRQQRAKCAAAAI